MVNFDNVAQLVRNVLEEDPIPFQNINLNTAESINFVANSIWGKYQTEWKLVARDKTEELMLAVLIYSDEIDRIMKKQAMRKTELARINREIWQDDTRVAALEAEIRRLMGK